MRLSLAKPDSPYGRHLILSCSMGQAADVRSVINAEILEGKATAVTEVIEDRNGDKKTIFRMHERYLDHLILAFPMADLSPVIDGRLRKAEEKRLAGMEVPALWFPKMRRSMRKRMTDYQKIAVGKIVDREILLLNDEMGLGKTVTALASMCIMDAFPALVVCPNSAVDEWVAQIEEHFHHLSYSIVGGSRAERNAAVWEEFDITIVNYEAIRAKALYEGEDRRGKIVGWEFATEALFDRKFKFAVLDEHHRVKNPYSQTAQGFFQLEAEEWLYMSGTPLLNRPEEIWPVLHKSFPEEFPNYNQFVAGIIAKKAKSEEGKEVVVGYKPKALKELRNLIHEISLRRRRDQVLQGLPEVIHTIKHIELDDEARRLYEMIENEMFMEMEDGSIVDIFGALPQIMRLKQAAFSPELYGGSPVSAKIEELKSIIETLVENNEKAIVFSQWSKATRILQRELSQYNPAYVDGTVKRRGPGGTRPRYEQAQKFMLDPECKVYIGTIGANREAINLGVASYVIFTDMPWTPGEVDQATGRSAAGGLRGLNIRKGLKVHVIELQAKNTIEQWIQSVQKRKRGLTSRSIDRDGGKKFSPVTLDDLRSVLGGRRK